MWCWSCCFEVCRFQERVIENPREKIPVNNLGDFIDMVSDLVDYDSQNFEIIEFDPSEENIDEFLHNIKKHFEENKEDDDFNVD